MNQYIFTENDGEGTLKKKVHQEGQPDTWEEDMRIPLPTEPIDKEYVDKKVKEAEEDYKGEYTTLKDIESITDANDNDYAYLITQDENDNDVYNRYRFRKDSGWTFDVAIKRDNFTNSQWNAISSGITPALVAKLSALPTNEELNQVLSQKLENSDLASVIDTIAIADQTNGDITIQYDDGQGDNNEE